MGISFKTFLTAVPFVTAVKKPVLMRGRHGIGKSELVYQFAKLRGLPVVERRASQMTEGDLLGLPTIDGNVTKWNPPNWFKQACDMPVVLFLDEVDRAVTEVRQGIFELTDSRKLSGFNLHPDTLIFAAVNGGVHGSQYQVGEMDPAELDRWTVFDVEPTVEDFMDFAKGKIHDMTWDFLNTNRNHLEHKGESEPNKVYPSRRSWVRFDECLNVGGMLGKEKEETKKALPVMYELACGFVGMEAAVAFRDFVDNYERQLSIDDVFAGKHGKMKDLKINEYVSLIDKIAASDRLKTKLSAKEMTNIAEFFKLLPAEAFMKFYKVLGDQNNENMIGVHVKIADIVVKTINGEQEKEKNKAK